MKLSVLDNMLMNEYQTPKGLLDETIVLVRHLEKLGFTRFWISEHHNSVATISSAPEILVGFLASNTNHIRIGAGCILLPFYSPLKVAECFKQLELLYPNRIDLGVGRASGCDELTSYLLNPSKNDSYPEFIVKLSDLRNYLTNNHDSRTVKSKVKVIPYIDETPVLWLMGSSIQSAKFAGNLGLSYSFAHFLKPQDFKTAMKNYVSQFLPSKDLLLVDHGPANMPHIANNFSFH